MAKREQFAEYVCVNKCTWPVVQSDGVVVDKLFVAEAELEKADGWKEGGVSRDRVSLRVPQGEIVGKHFVPANDVAEDDREDQLSNPAKYIETDRDIALLAELMVKKGWFKPVMGTSKDEQGRLSIEKTAKQVAVDAIKAENDIKDEDVLPATDDLERSKAIKDLMSRADDDKERRKVFGAMLTEADVKFFRGADPEALAAMVYDEGLYDG